MKTFIELYAGIGVVRWALEQTGWTCLKANDISEKKARVYHANFPDDGKLVLADVTTLPDDFFAGADLISACFPCQDFSRGGLKSGFSGTRSSTILTVLQKIGKLSEGQKPKIILMENVPGLLNDSAAMGQIMEHLGKAGFSNVDLRTIDAAH